MGTYMELRSCSAMISVFDQIYGVDWLGVVVGLCLGSRVLEEEKAARWSATTFHVHAFHLVP